MSILDNVNNDDIRKDTMDHVEVEHEEFMEQPSGIGIDLEFLKAKSPDRPVEEYINHPLNFNNSKGLARTLRGLEGMFNDLRYAVIDVIVGLMEFSKERKIKSE